MKQDDVKSRLMVIPDAGSYFLAGAFVVRVMYHIGDWAAWLTRAFGLLSMFIGFVIVLNTIEFVSSKFKFVPWIVSKKDWTFLIVFTLTVPLILEDALKHERLVSIPSAVFLTLVVLAILWNSLREIYKNGALQLIILGLIISLSALLSLLNGASKLTMVFF